MALKLNNIKLILLGLAFFTYHLDAQDMAATDSSVLYDDTTDYINQNVVLDKSDYKEGYHFHDSDQSYYNSKSLVPKFERKHWQETKKDMTFEEDSFVAEIEKKRDLPNTNSFTGFNLEKYKYVFISFALFILGIVIFLLLRNTKLNKNKITSNLLINFDDLDEQTIRDTEFITPLNLALKEGDFKTAYRIKYLTVLQHLISKNLIVYKKEKTNYDYLLQLNGLSVYESFRYLTFNFDGIWYGELFIDEARFNKLLPYFNNFEEAMKKVS